MKSKLALKVAGGIFLVIALLHLVRLVMKVQVTIAHFPVPFWVSTIGFLLAIGLALGMFMAMKD